MYKRQEESSVKSDTYSISISFAKGRRGTDREAWFTPTQAQDTSHGADRRDSRALRISDGARFVSEWRRGASMLQEDEDHVLTTDRTSARPLTIGTNTDAAWLLQRLTGVSAVFRTILAIVRPPRVTQYM